MLILPSSSHFLLPLQVGQQAQLNHQLFSETGQFLLGKEKEVFIFSVSWLSAFPFSKTVELSALLICVKAICACWPQTCHPWSEPTDEEPGVQSSLGTSCSWVPTEPAGCCYIRLWRLPVGPFCGWTDPILLSQEWQEAQRATYTKGLPQDRTLPPDQPQIH